EIYAGAVYRWYVRRFGARFSSSGRTTDQSLMRAATGRWSLPVAGRVQVVTGVAGEPDADGRQVDHVRGQVAVGRPLGGSQAAVPVFSGAGGSEGMPGPEMAPPANGGLRSQADVRVRSAAVLEGAGIGAAADGAAPLDAGGWGGAAERAGV